MRTPLIFALAVILLATLLPQGGAFHPCCECPTYATSGVSGVGAATTEAGVSRSFQTYVSAVKGNFYIVNDAVASTEWLLSLWIYQETNGVAGLQRHDDFCYTPGYNAPGMSDTIIW